MNAEVSKESNKMASESPKPPSSCSICLEPILDFKERSIAILKCNHEFHLDCIGSAFNSKGIMQCPNCRNIENGEWLFANGSNDQVYFDEYELNLDREFFMARLHGFREPHDFEGDDEFDDDELNTDDGIFTSENIGPQVDGWDAYFDTAQFVSFENHDEEAISDFGEHHYGPQFSGSTHTPVPSQSQNQSQTRGQHQSQNRPTYPNPRFYCPYANPSVFSPTSDIHSTSSNQESRFYSYMNHLRSSTTPNSFSSSFSAPPLPPPFQSHGFMSQPFHNQSQPFQNQPYPNPPFSTPPFPNPRYSNPSFSPSPLSSLTPSPTYTSSLFPYQSIPNIWESSDHGLNHQRTREWRSLFPPPASPPYPDNPSFPHTYSPRPSPSPSPPFPRPSTISSWTDEIQYPQTIGHTSDFPFHTRNSSLNQNFRRPVSRLNSDSTSRVDAEIDLSLRPEARDFNDLMGDYSSYRGDGHGETEERSMGEGGERKGKSEVPRGEGREDFSSGTLGNRSRERTARREEEEERGQSRYRQRMVRNNSSQGHDLDVLFRERRGRRENEERLVENMIRERRERRNVGNSSEETVHDGVERRDYGDGFESMWRERMERRERTRIVRFNSMSREERNLNATESESGRQREEREERKERDGESEERRGVENGEEREKDLIREVEERIRRDLREKESDRELEREKERERMRGVEREIIKCRERIREREQERKEKEKEREKNRERERSFRMEREERRVRNAREERMDKESKREKDEEGEREVGEEMQERERNQREIGEKGKEHERRGERVEREGKTEAGEEREGGGENRSDSMMVGRYRRENWTDYRSPSRFNSVYGNNRNNNNTNYNNGFMSNGRSNNGEGVQRQEWRIKLDPSSSSSPSSLSVSDLIFPSASSSSMSLSKDKKEDNLLTVGIAMSENSEGTSGSTFSESDHVSIPAGIHHAHSKNSSSPSNINYGDLGDYFLPRGKILFDSKTTDGSPNHISVGSKDGMTGERNVQSNQIVTGGSVASKSDLPSGEFFCNFHEFTARHGKKMVDLKQLMEKDKDLVRKDVISVGSSIELEDSDSLEFEKWKTEQDEKWNKMKLKENSY